MDLLESARVATRLTVMASATTVTVERLRWRARLRGSCPHAAVRRGHAWARRVLPSLGIDLDVSGAPPSERVLLLANHRSYIDIPVLLSQVPCSFLAKAEIATWPVFGAAARLTHTVFVQRENRESRREARAGALARLRQGLTFAAFPEGTTSRGPGTLPFFPGLFQLASEYAIPVVPVAIDYDDPDAAWVDDDPFLEHFLSCFRKRRLGVSIAFGPALRAENAGDLKSATEGWIRSRLTERLTQRPAARPASAPALGAGPAARPQPSAA